MKKLLVACLAFISVAGVGYSKDYKSGKVFHHKHWVKFECPGVEIYRIRKEWYSSGGVIKRVENFSKGKRRGRSYKQSSFFEYKVRHYPRKNEKVPASLVFYTNPGMSGRVTTIFTFFWRSKKCKNRKTTSVVSSNILR